jgi:predicted MFS family arabinose efflux permease
VSETTNEGRAWEVLKLSHFRSLWIANGLYFAGQQIALISAQWFILDQSSSKTALGLAALIQGSMVLALSPLGGVLAERSSRRNLLALGRAGLALPCVAMAILTFTGQATLWHALLSAAVIGTFIAITQPATATFIYDIVGQRRLTSAIALNASSQSLFNIAGPALGGLVIAVSGVAATYAIGGLAYAVGIVFMLLIPVIGKTRQVAQSNAFRDVAEGMRFVATDPLMVWLMGFCFATVVGSWVNLLRPVYAREILNVGAPGLGLLSAFYSAGSLVSAFFMALFLEKIKRLGIALALINTEYVIAFAVFAVSTNFAVSLIAQFFMGIVGPIWLAMIQTILQTSAPPHMRSRVMSVYFMAMQSATIGQFVAGALADLLGGVWTLLIAAAIQGSFLLLALFFAKPVREFRVSMPTPATATLTVAEPQPIHQLT